MPNHLFHILLIVCTTLRIELPSPQLSSLKVSFLIFWRWNFKFSINILKTLWSYPNFFAPHWQMAHPWKVLHIYSATFCRPGMTSHDIIPKQWGGGICWNLQNFLWSCHFPKMNGGVSVYGGGQSRITVKRWG